MEDPPIGNFPKAGQLVKGGRIPLKDATGKLKGKFAWWVAENAAKALINTKDEKLRAGQTNAEVMLAAGTPGPGGLSAISDLGIDPTTTNTPATDKLISLGQTQLVTTAKTAGQAHFHDLTAEARSLLTNVTTGGLRKDLSLYFDQGTPELGGSWTKSIKDGTPPLGPNGKAALSPYNEYDTGDWKQPRQHHKLYTSLVGQAAGKSLLAGAATAQAADDLATNFFRDPYPIWNYQRKLITPVVVRYSVILSPGVQDVSGSAILGGMTPDKFNSELLRYKGPLQHLRPYDPASSKYVLTFHAYPVVSLWKPYNVPTSCPGFTATMLGTSIVHPIRVPGVATQPIYTWLDMYHNQYPYQYVDSTDRGIASGPLSFAPGEVKVLFGNPGTLPSHRMA